MSPTLYYFDNNATTPMDPEVLDAMTPYLTSHAGNPSSRHAIGRRARQAVDKAKQQIANALNAEPEQILFTSGATESNNLAILGQYVVGTGKRVLVSVAEHPSALEPAKRLAERGFIVEELPLDEDGVVRSIEDRMDDSAALLVIQLANSETGCLQPIEDVANARPSGCWFHCDAVQAIGRTPVDFAGLNVDSLSLSGHKIHGPSGTGALLLRHPNRLRPRLFGGRQQNDLRPGTESVASIVGLGKAVEIACRDLSYRAEQLRSLRDLFELRIAERAKETVFNVPRRRLPNVSNVSFLGAKAEAMLIALDLAGVCCSAGTACASGSLEPSPVLKAMGIAGDRLESALRFSFGRFNSDEEIEPAVDAILCAYDRVRRSLPAFP